MTGFNILDHSIQMIFRNFGSIVKLALMPTIILIAVFAGFFTLLEGASFGEGVSAELVLFSFAAVIIAIACMLWIIVGWHRFVLLEEYPNGWGAPFRAGRILSYAAHSLWVSFILSICLAVPLFLILPMVFQTGNFPNISLLSNVVSFVGTMIFLRLSVILPSAAIGKSIGIGAAWRATKGSMGALAVITAAVFAANFVASNVQTVAEYGDPPFYVEILHIVVDVAVALLGISIITTLYGHYVEGRPITG